MPHRHGSREEEEPTETTPLTSKATASTHHNLAGLSAWRFRLICFALWTCVFLGALDSTIIATLLTPIGSAFNASNQAQWLGTSYLLSVAVFTPIYGRLADIIGRRWAHLTALGFFTIGTCLCAISTSMETLIVARTIAGMGGGGINTVGVIILTDIIDLRRRGIFQGYANVFFGAGAALGGPFGGWINDNFGWRVAFWVQAPLLVCAAIGVFTNIHFETKASESDWKTKLARIDYLGSLTLVGSVGSFLLALSLKTSSIRSDGAEYAWTDPLILGLFATSMVSTIAFLLVERYVSPEPILPLSLLFRRTPLGCSICNFFLTINQFSILYNVPLFFSAVRLQSASVAGAHLLTISIMVCFGSLATGFIMRRTGRYWWLTIFCQCLIISTAIMLCFWNSRSPAWLTWVGQSPTGLGYAGTLTTTLVALMNEVGRVGKGEQAVATSMSYLFRYVGQVLGVAASASIIQAILKSDLSRSITGPDADKIISTIRQSTSSISKLSPEYQAAAIAGYEHALHVVFICNLGMALLGFLGFLLVEDLELPDGSGKDLRASQVEDHDRE